MGSIATTHMERGMTGGILFEEFCMGNFMWLSPVGTTATTQIERGMYGGILLEAICMGSCTWWSPLGTVATTQIEREMRGGVSCLRRFACAMNAVGSIGY